MSEPQDDSANGDNAGIAIAAIYARVSSTGQLGRDGDADGYSIPAQVQACERKAGDLDAAVAKAYIERAESARSDDRPVLQQMLKELPDLGVKYLVVHKVDRLARNRLDDATLYQQLVGLGITLVSASENIDETPAGRLMHGMLATFAEYYSNNLATEIKKGLLQKHRNGGTPFKPPVGYLTKRELIGSQDIRTVVVDPARAQLVKLAFDLYATGRWTLHMLADHLEAQGLRSRPTPKRGPQPLRATTLHKMLRNRYYAGLVTYCGRTVPGRHQPLIDWETFDRVQAALASRAVAGERGYRHEHYLRGTIYCAECGGRLLYGRHKSKTGARYEYFCCTNRVSRKTGGRCSSGHLPVSDVERKIECYYRTVRLPKFKQEEIRDDMRRDADGRQGVFRVEVERQQRKLEGLRGNQAHLVQLSYKGLVSNEVLAREQRRLEDEERQARRLLRQAELEMQDVDAALEEALARTNTPHATYLVSTPMERRIMNQTFFEKLFIGAEGGVNGVELTAAYQAMAAWDEAFGRYVSAEGGAQPEHTPEGSSENPDPVFQDRGSHLNQMVEAGGIEPPTPACKAGVFPLAPRPRNGSVLDLPRMASSSQDGSANGQW
jgi:site-specific DNA recombinase